MTLVLQALSPQAGRSKVKEILDQLWILALTLERPTEPCIPCDQNICNVAWGLSEVGFKSDQ